MFLMNNYINKHGEISFILFANYVKKHAEVSFILVYKSPEGNKTAINKHLE